MTKKTDSNRTQISLVIPTFNESGNVVLLANEITQTLMQLGLDWECVWVDDASTDNTWEEICALKSPHRGIKLKKNSGQSTAIMAGIDESKFNLIVTMDADLQNDPNDIPKMLKLVKDSNDVICGIRINRQDKLILRVVPSKIANYIARKISGINIHDLGCTLRVFDRRLISDNRIMGEMHRVLVMHLANSGANLVEIPVNHRPRKYGTSKYGIERTFKFVADVMLAQAFKTLTSKPLYFFGKLAMYILAGALSLFVTAVIMKLTGFKSHLDTSLIVGSAVLVAASLINLSIGLMSELLLRSIIFSNQSFQYEIKSRKS